MKSFFNSILIFTCLISTQLSGFGQEKLYDLVHSRANHIQAPIENNSSRINILKYPFIYVIDTLSLPFFDDFSTDNIKRYDAKFTDPNVSLKINYDFSVNGQYPSYLEYRSDPTFSILKTLNGEIITSENPVLHIVFYTDGQIVGRDTGWTNLITEFDQSSGSVNYDTLLAEKVLTNTPDTFYKVADDYTLWTAPIDSFDSIHATPLINNSFAKNPVTQGVATFDGTDGLGNPYDNSSETTYGLCDMLLSKPIALDSNMENVFLSFFYQAGGNGNLPEEEDSLVLELFDVVDSTWRFAWKKIGPTAEDTLFSDQVFIKIDGRKYLKPGFRFRFKNYATQSGNLDHWHIDYVRLGQDRDTIADDTTLNDVAFVSGIQSFISPYSSAPYSHYIADPAFFDASEVSIVNTNLGSTSMVMSGLRFEIFDPAENLILSEETVDPNISPNTVRKTTYPISAAQVFPDLATNTAEFTYRTRYTATGLGNTYKINDTIYGKQSFGHHYSYDDGSAEKAYALTGAGVVLAYEFNSPIGDSLKGMLFNFPRMLHNDNEDLSIELLVWNDLNSEPIYEAEQAVEPAYTNANEFFRISLDQPVYVEGQFFIGYRQREATKVYIGYDVNTNNSEKMNYKIGETWYQSSFEGSLMLRPDFGTGEILGLETIKNENQDITVYPNPANDLVNIKIQNALIRSIVLYDIAGRQCLKTTIASNQIDVSSLKNGIYLMQVITNDNSNYTKKIMVSH